MKFLFLLGESGVGKTAISCELAKDDRFNLIKSYTDRPKREEDEDHIFVTKEEFSSVLVENTLAAYTNIDGYRYLSLRNQFDDKKINVYTTDVRGVNDVIRSFPTGEFMSILITRKNVHIDQMRKNRIIELPSRRQVDFAIANDEDSLDPVVNIIKFLALYDDGTFFVSPYAHVLSLKEEIKNFERQSQEAWDQAQLLREELNVYIKTSD